MRRVTWFLYSVQVGLICLSLIQNGCRCESPAAKALSAPSLVKPSDTRQKTEGACDSAAAFVCNEIGEKSGVCELIQGAKETMTPDRCEKMLADPERTLMDLRQMEESRLPLSIDKQALLAASDPPSYGPDDAPVTVVLFSDFDCSNCVYTGHYARELKNDFGNDVRVIFRHHPEGGRWSFLAAEASLAAHAQGRFWEYYTQLFNNPHDMSRETIFRCAKEIGLDLKAFERSLENHDHRVAVEADIALGRTVLVGPAPYFFVNGRRVSTVNNLAELKSAIKDEIQKLR